MIINEDFRLLDVSIELDALDTHYDLIEKHISTLNLTAQALLDKLLCNENDAAERQFAHQDYYEKVEFLYPRLFWGPFIVSLYAVFETSVKEIAGLIQRRQIQERSINELRGDFLKKAMSYYKNVIKFELCSNNTEWERIKVLTEVRHTIAHANGRMDMLKEGSKKKIIAIVEQDIGISLNHSYIMVNSHFAHEMYSTVRSFLENLIARYMQRYNDSGK